MSAPVIRFDAETHTYTLVATGEVIPSVTQILRATGVSTDFESLRRMGGERAAAIDLKRDIGTALHADAHAFDDGDLVWESVDPRVLPYLEAWKAFREAKRLTPKARERVLYHPVLRYAGTLDGVFITPSGKTVIVDIKTGDPEDSACRYQTVGYQLAYEFGGDVIQERWAVQLIPDRSVPFVITPYTDYRDGRTWQAIVATFYAQPAQRRTAA